MEKIKAFVGNNKNFVGATLVALVAMVAVLIWVREEVARFTFIMPIFAGWILYLILTEVEDEDLASTEVKKEKTEGARKKAKPAKKNPRKRARKGKK